MHNRKGRFFQFRLLLSVISPKDNIRSCPFLLAMARKFLNRSTPSRKKASFRGNTPSAPSPRGSPGLGAWRAEASGTASLPGSCGRPGVPFRARPVGSPSSHCMQRRRFVRELLCNVDKPTILEQEQENKKTKNVARCSVVAMLCVAGMAATLCADTGPSVVDGGRLSHSAKRMLRLCVG